MRLHLFPTDRRKLKGKKKNYKKSGARKSVLVHFDKVKDKRNEKKTNVDTLSDNEKSSCRYGRPALFNKLSFQYNFVF